MQADCPILLLRTPSSRCTHQLSVQSDSPIQQVVKEHQPVDVSAVPNAAALEKLGLERLKAELSRHGLKAGGSLAE
jgi:hypothetical protein